MFSQNAVTLVNLKKVNSRIDEILATDQGTFPLSIADIPHLEAADFFIIGEIVGVLAEKSVLNDKGKVDPTKLNAFVFDQFQSCYYAIREKVGQAWRSDVPMMKKQKRSQPLAVFLRRGVV